MNYGKILTSVFVSFFTLASAQVALAGTGDPVPLLNGTQKAKHLWTIGGFGTSSTAALVVLCNSTEKAGGNDVTWAVEVFSDSTAQNDVTLGEGVLTMPAGQTWSFATRPTAFFLEDAIIDVDVSYGSARILSTSAKIVCTAYLVDDTGNPPSMMTTLPMFKKLKQRGQ
jgi:hypothetical protein